MQKEGTTSSSYFNCFSTMHKEDRSQTHTGSKSINNGLLGGTEYAQGGTM